MKMEESDKDKYLNESHLTSTKRWAEGNTKQQI